MKWIAVEINQAIPPDKPGVYKIQLVDRDSRPIEIHRFGGVDKEGVLAIGCSKHIDTRRKQFAQSSGGKRGHSEGIQWWLVNHFSGLAQRNHHRFVYARFETKEEALRVEMEELQSYLREFWETPPLNRAIPKRIEWFMQLRGQ